MARGLFKRFALGVAAAAVVLSLSASAVLAGEVTGSGKNSDQNQGRSWCSFSGHNDDPGAPLDGSGPNGPGGHSQSFGQDVKLGLENPHEGNPGFFCNPNHTPLPPQPNRKH
jgi:opacity protein-like surface antigen